jgi:PAS domain S-box-containing protein
MSFLKTANRLLFNDQLFFAAVILIAIGSLALCETAVLSASYRQALLAGTAGVCVALAFAALVIELLVRAEDLEHKSQEIAHIAEALRESEAQLLDYALTSSDWFWETDTQHRFTFVSDDIRAHGLAPEDCIGRTHQEIACGSASNPQKWRDHITDLENHQIFRDFVYVYRIRERGEQSVSVSGRPIFDTMGRFRGYRGTARDVTEKVAAEYRLHEAVRVAEKANVAKSNFLANMNHELRTPLNAILGFSEMLVLGTVGSLPPRIKDYLGIIHKSASHLLEVVNDVLDIARIEAGKVELQEEEFHPSSIIGACVQIVSANAQAKGLKLVIESGDDDPFSLWGDERRLRQVLFNLLSNAIKFTQPGGTIIVRTRYDADGNVAFQVQDNGPGMTAEEVIIALEPFGQVDAGLARCHEGTGLGLPLARSLTELHGGTLQIESERGHGTTVTVTIPAERLRTRKSLSERAVGRGTLLESAS